MAEINLRSEADGLFGTHVTFEDIEKDMQRVFNSKATFGENKTVQNIGDGNGFLSKICLINADWQNYDTDELPKAFIAKICTPLTIIALSKKMAEETGEDFLGAPEAIKFLEEGVKKAHNAEVKVYELLDKYHVKIPRCKVYYSHPYSEESPLKGYLIMEAKTDLASVHVHHTFKPDDLDEALRGIASMQAMTVKMTEEEKNFFTHRFVGELMSKFFNKKAEDSMMNMTKVAVSGVKLDLVNKFEPVFRTILDPEFHDTIPEKLGYPYIFCHGDLWNTNILWTKKEDDKLHISAVIDYQTANMGSPGMDIARLLLSNLTGKDRIEHTDRLLDKFYSFLEEELEDQKPLYTKEQLYESYKLFFPMACYMVAGMFVGAADHILKDKLSEEEFIEAKEKCWEKFEALVNELIADQEQKKLH